MAMEGTLKSRNGKLYVLYTSNEYSEPFRQCLWWRVLEARGTGYGERPEAEDIATSTSGGGWQTRNPSTRRSTGSVSTGTGSTQAETVERVSIKPPSAGGKELRWREGRWEKLTARGWAPAGESKPKTSKKKSSSGHSTTKRHNAKKKSSAQLDREIREAMFVSDAEIEAFLETLDVTQDPEDQGMVDDAYAALVGDDKARKRLTAIIRTSHYATKVSKAKKKSVSRCGWIPDADAYEVAREFAFNWTGGAVKQACIPTINIRSAPIEDVPAFNSLVKALGNPTTAKKVPPMVVERAGTGTDYRIVDGRHRLAAANKHGFARVPVIIVESN